MPTLDQLQQAMAQAASDVQANEHVVHSATVTALLVFLVGLIVLALVEEGKKS